MIFGLFAAKKTLWQQAVPVLKSIGLFLGFGAAMMVGGKIGEDVYEAGKRRLSARDLRRIRAKAKAEGDLALAAACDEQLNQPLA